MSNINYFYLQPLSIAEKTNELYCKSFMLLPKQNARRGEINRTLISTEAGIVNIIVVVLTNQKPNLVTYCSINATVGRIGRRYTRLIVVPSFVD